MAELKLKKFRTREKVESLITVWIWNECLLPRKQLFYTGTSLWTGGSLLQ